MKKNDSRIELTLPIDLKKRIIAAAAKEGRSVNNLIRWLIKKFLEKSAP